MSTLNSNPIAKAVRTALLAGTAAALAMPSVYAAEDEEGEKVTITGSRIKRAQVEGATPITVITAEDMEQQGRFTVADALRNANVNSFGSFNERSGSTAQSQATVSLLGAGSNRTLVLMDGYRLPGSPSLGGTAVNLNQIPMAMVERIEVMLDGGSAVYGSDAIAGVINIITKKNIDGLTIAGSIGSPSDKGGEEEEFSLTMGITGDKGSLSVAFEHQEAKPVFDVDRPYTAARFNDDNGDGVIALNVETSGISRFGATIRNPNTGLWEPSPECSNLQATVPGFVGEFSYQGGMVCGFAYANVSANKASLNRNSVFINGEYEVDEDTQFFTRMIFAQNESFGRYAPPAASFPLIPANSTHNPYNTDTSGTFRWYQLGNRNGNVADYTQDYVAGFRGMFGETAEWEAYFHYNDTDNKSIGNTYLSVSGLFTNLYFNIPFDTPTGLSYLGATTVQEDRNIFAQWFAGVGFETGELSGGAISHYVGAEYYDVRYHSLVDKQSEAGLVGGSAGNSSERTRDVTSVFYELSLPFTEEFEVNFAGRYDDYSDFGNEFSPKVSATYRPSDSLVFRASWGEGFRAPTLSELSQADAFSAEFATDYVWCAANNIAAADCSEDQFNTTVQSNANLSAEESEFTNLGVVWTATDDLTIKADYYDLEITGAIGYLSVQSLIYMELTGTSVPPTSNPVGLVRNTTTGGIEEAFTSSENGSALSTTGLNTEISYKMGLGDGQLNLSWMMNYVMTYETDIFFSGPLQDTAAWAGQPEFRNQLTASYNVGDHTFTWNFDHIGSTKGKEEPLVSGSTVQLIATEDLESTGYHNLLYTYDAGSWGRYSIGVRNATDEDPVLSVDGEFDNPDLYTPGHVGRMWTAGFTLSF